MMTSSHLGMVPGTSYISVLRSPYQGMVKAGEGTLNVLISIEPNLGWPGLKGWVKGEAGCPTEELGSRSWKLPGSLWNGDRLQGCHSAPQSCLSS